MEIQISFVGKKKTNHVVPIQSLASETYAFLHARQKHVVINIKETTVIG